MARENAANLGLDGRATFLRTEWAAGFGDDSFDLVVSNPPYIPSDDIPGLDPEVRDHDPLLALDGGPDGLQAYRDLAPEIARILKPGGTFAVEIGWDQGPAVQALFEAAGLDGCEGGQGSGRPGSRRHQRPGPPDDTDPVVLGRPDGEGMEKSPFKAHDLALDVACLPLIRIVLDRLRCSDARSGRA